MTAADIETADFACMEALAFLQEEQEIVKSLGVLPPAYQPIVEQALVVAFWVGHCKANADRLAEIERMEAEAIEKMGH